MTTTSSASRLSSQEQAQLIYQILSDVYDKSPWTMEQVVADLALDTTEYFYVYDQEEVVGFLALQNLVGELEVTNIAVLKAYQGRGYASQLMKHLEERSEPIFLEVRTSNQVAQALYRKFGFESLGIRKNYYHEPQEVVTLCIKDALSEAGITAEQLDAVAVTYGPGLVGALLVGMAAAKAFAWAHGLPLIPVNHMAGHLMAAREVQELEYPLLALLVSGGHTELVYVSEPGNYKIVGETRDDAVGEAYDKVGRVMGLTYPAGREIDELAHKGKDVYDFPRAMIKEDHLEFSFSGLKSAFINLHHNAEQKGEVLVREDLCASFQAAVLDILLAKTKKALERYPVKTLVVAGGVAANQGLRERLAEEITDVDVVIPPLRLCGDNAGMIALAAAIECDQKHFAELDLNAKPSLAFAGFEE